MVRKKRVAKKRALSPVEREIHRKRKQIEKIDAEITELNATHEVTVKRLTSKKREIESVIRALSS